jgi:hypothetical protein
LCFIEYRDVVGVDESPGQRVVVPCSQITEAGFVVMVIAAVSVRVEVSYEVRIRILISVGIQDLVVAPCVVYVFCFDIPVAVKDMCYVALDVLSVVVLFFICSSVL